MNDGELVSARVSQLIRPDSAACRTQNRYTQLDHVELVLEAFSTGGTRSPGALPGDNQASTSFTLWRFRQSESLFLPAANRGPTKSGRYQQTV